MATLRSDEGCAWDRKQTASGFKTFLVEEVYEIIDGIEKDDADMVREELGDLLFHIVFIAQIFKEQGRFDIADVLNGIYTKMFNRHPHVFKKESSLGPGEVEDRWEELKKAEKENYSPLAGIPSTLPALLRAYTLTRRAAKVGFDWPKIDNVFEKMEEEISELKKEVTAGNHPSIKDEIGDVLFTMVNLARFFHVDPEDALRGTIDKFISRFSYVEKNIKLSEASLETMDKLWNEAKLMEKKGE